MSDPARSERAGIASAVLALGVLLIAAALLWQAVEQRSGGMFVPPGPIGSLESVQLTNGLVFYGTLGQADASTVRLDGVYEIQITTQAANQAGQQPVRTTRLARRHGQDWHGPGSMAIPVSNILFMEAVPSGSEVQKLIRADQ